MSWIQWLTRTEVPLGDDSDPPCHPISLPKGGTIVLDAENTVVLDQNAVFEPLCENGARPEPIGPATILDYAGPFYASTSPQLYAIATATVISYLLVIMLFITPRTFFIGGRGGGFLGRRGMIGGSYGTSSVIGVGGRPWLQKVAALTLAVSLTIASVDSFRVAKEQYDMGYMDSDALTNDVLNGLELRIIRVISSTFLWLAQVQTLIRLFPRHKEKVIIKWVGFALIVLDIIFTILNNFVNSTNGLFRPRNIVDAIPALNYLFDLSLSLLYAAWVIFYSLSKHRFAYFHPKMKNICLVALLSLIAVLIPIIFFIVDLSKPTLAAWGEYIRWVGAAAASVVVWEWVERIEALEREERKDGILGREIFDGDEMLDVTPSHEVDWPGSRRSGGSSGDGGGGAQGGGNAGATSGWADRLGLSHLPLRSRVQRIPRPRRPKLQRTDTGPPTPHLTIPSQAATPVSRAETASAASTIYRVRYHSTASPAPSVSGGSPEDGDTELEKEPSILENGGHGGGRRGYDEHGSTAPQTLKQGPAWLNLFKRRRASPPQEVATAQAAEGGNHSRTVGSEKDSRWNRKPKTSGFLSFFQRNEDKFTSGDDGSESLPVTVIPARSRRRASTSMSEQSDTTVANTIHPRRHSHAHPHPPAPPVVESHRQNDSLPVMVIPAQPRPWSTPVSENQNSSPVANNSTSEAPNRRSPNRESPALSSPRTTGSEHFTREAPDRSPDQHGLDSFSTVREEDADDDGVPSTSPSAPSRLAQGSEPSDPDPGPSAAGHQPSRGVDSSGPGPSNNNSSSSNSNIQGSGRLRWSLTPTPGQRRAEDRASPYSHSEHGIR